MSTKFTELVPKPSAASINSGLSNLTQKTCLRIFGEPAEKKTTDCTDVTAKRLAKRIVTEDVGPFKVTGHTAAVQSLKRIFDNVKRADPELYAAVGTAGMLCCRKVRGGTGWSNHSFGFAIDVTMNGLLDTRGDDEVQKGTLTLYKYFRAEGWWWGAEFPTEDAMHFEVAEETILQWERDGKL